MRNLKIWGLLVLMTLSLTHCKGQKKDLNNKENMQQFITEKIEKYLDHYTTTPIYSLQVSKQGCRMVIESYNRDYRFVENRGESMMIPFNYMITKSGEQKVKIKVYPKEGEQYLTKYAHVQVKVYNAPDKDSSLKDYSVIGEFVLPQGLEPQKLPYYEGVITFKAEVPFDYSIDLAEAKDLTKVPNIKDMVKKKYKEIQDISKKNDINEYISQNSFFIGRYYNTIYTSLNDVIKDFQKYGNLRYSLTSPLGYDKEFLSLDDCELQFYAGGKVVSIWHKKILTGGLSKYFKYKNDEGKEVKSFDDTPLFLYMPAGSNELKIW